MTALDTYLPFDAGAGSVNYEDNWRKMARGWEPTGVDLSYLNQFLVYGDSSGRQVKVKTGRGWVDGFYCENASEKTIALTTNTTLATRYDLIVLQLDPSANTISIEVVTGTVSATEPTLTQSITGVYQMPLARVTALLNYTTVAATDVLDRRPVSLGIDGAGGSMVKIGDSLLSSDTTPLIDLQNIPQTFSALRIIGKVRSKTAAALSQLDLRFNNDSSALYKHIFARLDSSGQTIAENTAATYAILGVMPGNTATANYFGSLAVDIPAYADAFFKEFTFQNGTLSTSGASTNNRYYHGASAYGSVNPINRVTIFDDGAGNLATGSRLLVYGIR